MSFEVSNLALISAVDIYVLNYPEELFGVPNFQLYQTSQATILDPDILDPDKDPDKDPDNARILIEVLEFDILNNDQLSMLDRTFRRVTLQLRDSIPSAGAGILLTWTFTDLYKVDFLGVSEIRFSDDISNFALGTIEFQTPANMETVEVVPSTQMLQSGSLMLTCTVASQGSFTWRWRKTGVELQSDDIISILSSDGTRTSILTINDLFNAFGFYVCTAGSDFPGAGSKTRSYSLQFPSKQNILASEVRK